jgi:hypothetical protein
MAAPVNVSAALTAKLGKHIDKSMLEAMRWQWMDGQDLFYSEGGPVIGYIGVFFTIPGTDLKKSFAPYAFSTNGLYVGYWRKAGMFKKAAEVQHFPTAAVASIRRAYKRESDGAIWRSIDLIGERHQELVSMSTLELAEPGPDFAHQSIMDISAAFGLPPHPEYDF